MASIDHTVMGPASQPAALLLLLAAALPALAAFESLSPLIPAAQVYPSSFCERGRHTHTHRASLEDEKRKRKKEKEENSLIKSRRSQSRDGLLDLIQAGHLG
jgi:hypothetical protein